jgi:hypothetical protein
MSKREFEIRFKGIAYIKLDDQVIDVVDDEWRKSLYKLYTPEQIAAHIAYNFIFNSGRLSMLDGWADQPDSNAEYQDVYEVDIYAEEL